MPVYFCTAEGAEAGTAGWCLFRSPFAPAADTESSCPLSTVYTWRRGCRIGGSNAESALPRERNLNERNMEKSDEPNPENGIVMYDKSMCNELESNLGQLPRACSAFSLRGEHMNHDYCMYCMILSYHRYIE
jgi:hypothetical protein